jgi:hypothetical protein
MSTFTQAHLVAIDEAIAGGYLEVRYDDKVVKYQTMSDLLKARALIVAQLNQGSSPIRKVYMTTARDYE